MDINQALTNVRAAAIRVEEAARSVASAKEELHRLALQALVTADDEAERHALVHGLYWEVRDLPVKTIEAVVGPRARVLEIVGPGPSLGTCTGCATELFATSRTDLTSGRQRCGACEREARRAERAAARKPAPWRWQDLEDFPEDTMREPPPEDGEDDLWEAW
jgi:hypothetical protein